jgi:hypothetical protein
VGYQAYQKMLAHNRVEVMETDGQQLTTTGESDGQQPTTTGESNGPSPVSNTQISISDVETIAFSPVFYTAPVPNQIPVPKYVHLSQFQSTASKTNPSGFNKAEQGPSPSAAELISFN